MGDDIVELSTTNEFFENGIHSHDEKWLEGPKAKLSKQFVMIK